MYLKNLSIRGFKSFADKTIVEFDPLGGITAIVGPNGCGKSNLVDAVRWVLGEQNPKELRSSALEEVIFAGSASRKPLSLAEVSLLLDNSDNKIKSEFSEIQIKRRTFRSNESEFQINKTNCRLKDIKDLFLDTGLGAGSYSIINQGQVDEILSSKPEDRRKVFEEAARINKYKFRKRAAERKLISTEQNLLRISDLKAEITNQLSTLSTQAEKAKHHTDLKNSLKELEIGVSKRQIKNLNDRKDSVLARIEELKKQGGQSSDSAKQIEENKIKNKEKLNNNEKEIENLRLEIGQIKLSYEENKSEILLNKEKERHLGEQLESIKHELETLLPQLDKLKSSLSEREIQEKKAKENLEKVDEEFNDIKQATENISNEQNKISEDIEKIKSKIFNDENSLMEERNNRVELDSSIKFVKEELKRDKELLSKLEEEANGLSLEKSTVSAGLSSLEGKLNENREKIDKLSRFLKDKQSEIENLQKQFIEKKELLDTKSSKHNILLEFQKSHEGYPKGVKEALRAGDRKTFGKVYGTISEQIKAKPEHETAISIALSARSLNIVVENDQTAQEIIKLLKANNLGRATFLPLNLIKEADLKNKLPNFKGIIDFASKLVKTNDKFSAVVEYLLGKTIVVDNLNNAIEIAKKKLPFKIVTLDGEYIPNYGTITGGSLSRSSIILGREREILALEEEVKMLKAQVESIEQIKNTASSEISSSEKDLKDHVEASLKFNIEQAKLNQNKEQIEEKVSSISEEIEMLQSSIKARNNEINEIDGEKSKISSSITTLEESVKTLNNNLKDKQGEFKLKEDEKEKINLKLTDLKVMHSNSELSLKHVSEEAERIESNIENLENMVGPKRQHTLKEKLDESRKIITKLENALPKIQGKEKEMTGKLENLQVEKGIIQREIEHLEEKIKSKTTEELEIKDVLSKEEVSLAKIDSEFETIGQLMQEEYNITIEQIMNTESEVTNVQQTKDEISRLKHEIAALGPVNLLAIEEYERAKERISFIENQYNDLMIARENLSNLIKELDNKAKIEFLNTIKIVNDHFSNIFATLFEGGEAKITLSSDENILEGGIEIVAKPGGKKWLSLNVMSGGERSLTAIALLFALLRTHPSPFTFLDEVDAALDEANIHRFTKLLKEFAKTTQIILITHNKQTMAMADTLYGITMEEPGVSKVVSVKFSKVAN